jgi:uncharacterized membrane protein YfcA
MTHWLMLALALLAAGAMVGFLAGLFGVGGGTVVVPILYEVFLSLGVPDELRMPLCAGTSLALIILPAAGQRAIRREPRAGLKYLEREWPWQC